jgi:hypothetical protein
MGTRWIGMLAPLGVPTGDGRRFLASGITSRELPLPLKWQRVDEDGHDDSVVVGLVDKLDITADAIMAEGELFDDLDPVMFDRLIKDVNEAKFLTSKKVIGPSVDTGSCAGIRVRVGTDEPITEIIDEEIWMEELETGIPVETEFLFTEYEVAAATLVTIPAFAECRPFELLEPAPATITAAVRSTGWDALPFAPRDEPWDGSAADARISEDAGIGGDSPDWESYAAAFLYQDSEADPETKGAYGFQIVDILDGTRMVFPRAVFAVAAVLQGARGGTMISDADQETMRAVVTDLYARMATEFDDPTIVAPWTSASIAIVAAMGAAPITYALKDFTQPKLSGIVPLTVTDDGRVFGFVATHDVCHVGIPGVCTTAPYAQDGFDRFHRYSLPGADGQPITVGRITYGNGKFTKACECCKGNDDHACNHMSMGGAIAHHDKMSVTAYVRAWEDTENNGIVVAGVIAPKATPEGIKALARGKVSGDWRTVGGNLELVEVLTLSRERPGFPLPRARMVDGLMMALTAAGTVRVQPADGAEGISIDYERLSALIAEKLSAMAPAPVVVDVVPVDDVTSGVDVDTVAVDSVVEELGLIFASRDRAEALRLLGEVETITHVLR